MVVIIHAVGYSPDLSMEFTSYLLKATVTVAVPLFFFVDGYLLSLSALNKKEISVGTIFENGTKIMDVYSNTETVVSDGKVSLNTDYSILLLEEKK